VIRGHFTIMRNVHMTVTSLVAVVAPRTTKIIKNGLLVFERRENLLQNYIFNFVFRFSQSSEIALESKNLNRRKTDFSKKGSGTG